MPTIILELLGRKFKVKSRSWEIALKANEGIPRDWESCLTRDRYTDQRFILFSSPDHKDYIMQIRSQALGYYIQYKLKFLGYYEQFDMRYEYKYGKVKLPTIKSTQTIWTNPNDV